MLGFDPKPMAYLGPPVEGGYDGPTNVKILASVVNNTLTVTLAPRGAWRPMWFPFRSPTATDGALLWRKARAPISINTVATGATLGTASSNVPFRIWIVAFDAGDGRIVPALWQSVTGGATPTAVGALDESLVTSSTAISGSATAAATFYTPTGVTLTSKAFCIVGYLEYSSGLATAGTYASAPSKLQLFGPGIKTPGAIVQTKYAATTADFTTSSATYVSSGNTISITPTSAINAVRVTAGATASCVAVSRAIRTQLSRGTTANTNMIGAESQVFGSASINDVGCFNVALDRPQTASAVSYAIQAKSVLGSDVTLYGTSVIGALTADEIMV